jgi:hypothetical protein
MKCAQKRITGSRLQITSQANLYNLRTVRRENSRTIRNQEENIRDIKLMNLTQIVRKNNLREICVEAYVNLRRVTSLHKFNLVKRENGTLLTRCFGRVEK